MIPVSSTTINKRGEWGQYYMEVVLVLLWFFFAKGGWNSNRIKIFSREEQRLVLGCLTWKESFQLYIKKIKNECLHLRFLSQKSIPPSLAQLSYSGRFPYSLCSLSIRKPAIPFCYFCAFLVSLEVVASYSEWLTWPSTVTFMVCLDSDNTKLHRFYISLLFLVYNFAYRGFFFLRNSYIML